MLLHLLHGVGLLTFVTLLYAEVLRRTERWPLLRTLVIGLLFGLGAVGSMLDPLELVPGVLTDGRSVLVALAAPYGGSLAAVIAGLMASGYRLSLGGPAALAGAVGPMMAAAAGILFHRFLRRGEGLSVTDHALLGILASLFSLTSISLLPGATLIADVLVKTGPPLSLTISVGVVVLGTMLNRERQRLSTLRALQEREARLRAIAISDPLTRLLNRRGLDQALDRELSRSRRTGAPLCALMIDADHFKRINDAHGHEAGDAVLVQIAEVLREQARQSDIVGRFGGEEFAMLLPDTPASGALLAAERIREAMRQIRVPDAPADAVTASIGIAALDAADQRGLGLLRAADLALYDAKNAGRDCCRVFEAAERPAPRT